MLTPFFFGDDVRDEASAKSADGERYAQLFHELLRRGVYAPPSQFEAWFVSLAHTESDVDVVVEAVNAAIAASR
jgi:glutamate-1-semialdehyde 2,1-aminomutase